MSFLPDPSHGSTYVLWAALLYAVIAAFGPENIRNKLLKSAEAVAMVPWILFIGVASEHTKYLFAADGLGPTELPFHPLMDLMYFIPVAGVSMVLIAGLLWFGAKRSGGEQRTISLLPHLIPGLFLLWHQLNAYFYTVKAERDFLYETGEFETGLSSYLPLLSTLFALLIVLLATSRIWNPNRATLCST